MPPAGALVGHHNATRCHPPRVEMANSGGDGKQTSAGFISCPPSSLLGRRFERDERRDYCQMLKWQQTRFCYF